MIVILSSTVSNLRSSMAGTRWSCWTQPAF